MSTDQNKVEIDEENEAWDYGRKKIKLNVAG